MHFSEVLKRLRLEKEWSQAELGKRIGSSGSSIGLYENGKRFPGYETLEALADTFNVDIDYLLGNGHVSKSIFIPVYGTIKAGIPNDAVQDILDFEEISPDMARKGEYIALQISGDSMEPRMFTGDVVIIRKQPDCENGQICAVMVNGDDATLKKVIKRNNGITLVALNPKYPPMNFSKEEIAGMPVSILGVAVEVRGKL